MMVMYNVSICDNYGNEDYLTTTNNFKKWLEESNKIRVLEGFEPESADSFLVERANLSIYNDGGKNYVDVH